MAYYLKLLQWWVSVREMDPQNNQQPSRAPQLETALVELRRRHDRLCDDFNQLRTRVLAFFTGELGLIALLFATGTKIPDIVYGLVFFVFGVSCIAASFIILLYLLKTVIWLQPPHPDALANAENFASNEDFLRHLNASYIASNESNLEQNTKRVHMFDKSLILLLAGVIILLVIKFGQEAVLWHNIVKR